MKEFLLVFRMDSSNEAAPSSPEQMQASMKPWQDWMGGIAAQNKLANPGNRLGSEGKMVKPGNVISNGPYVEMKEAIGGYVMVSAANLDEAAQLAKDCPILHIGGNVEVRPVVAMDSNE